MAARCSVVGAALIGGRSDDQQLVLVLTRRHHRFARREIHVDLGPHPDLARHVDPGLDGERDARNEQPLLARFQIVEMRSGAVQVARVDRVTGAMREILTVPALFDYGACRIIDLRAANRCVTLMAAGGYVVHTFPTGQGNVIGNPIVPVIKISGNPKTVRTMGEHIDLDVSGILRRDMTIPQAGDALIDMIVRTANGRLTAAEALGHREYVMTKLYRSA